MCFISWASKIFYAGLVLSVWQHVALFQPFLIRMRSDYLATRDVSLSFILTSQLVARQHLSKRHQRRWRTQQAEGTEGQARTTNYSQSFSQMGRCMEVWSLLTLDYISLYCLCPLHLHFEVAANRTRTAWCLCFRWFQAPYDWLGWRDAKTPSTQIRAACCQTHWAHIAVFVAPGCKKRMDFQMLTVQSPFLPMACRRSTCSMHIKHLD